MKPLIENVCQESSRHQKYREGVNVWICIRKNQQYLNDWCITVLAQTCSFHLSSQSVLKYILKYVVILKIIFDISQN